MQERTASVTKLTAVPKDRRTGDNLITLTESLVDASRVVLSDAARPKIERILKEHIKRHQLASFGFKPKNRLLFWGPPGCGKTLTAYYVAHELGLQIAVVRLNALISSFLGDTASHLQRIFDLASSRPMLLLLDEVDAIGKRRDDPNDVGELKRIVNGLLQAMDFFDSTRSVVIAASNHQYLLDPALWRRFDDVVHFPIPTQSECRDFIHRLLTGVKYDLSLDEEITNMRSFSFADIERVITEGLKTMVLDSRKQLTREDVHEQIVLHRDSLAASHVSGETE